VKLKDIAPAKMFAEITEQAGTSFDTSPANLWAQPNYVNLKCSATFDKTPYWAAVAIACTAANVRATTGTIGSSAEPVGLRITTAHAPAMPSWVGGAVLFRATGIRREAALDYADPVRAPERLRIGLSLALEPKLGRAWAIRGVDVDRALDENGKALVPATQPATPQRRLPRFNTGSMSSNVTVDFDYPAAGTGERLAELKGRVRIELPKETIELSVPDTPDKPEAAWATLGTNRLVIAPLAAAPGAGGRDDVELTLERGLGVSDEQWRDDVVGFPVRPRVWLVSAGANAAGAMKVFTTGGGASRNGPDAARVTAHFPDDAVKQLRAAGPTNLMVELTTGAQELAAPFEFHDLPLP
jgi:hypothetical protein